MAIIPFCQDMRSKKMIYYIPEEKVFYKAPESIPPTRQKVIKTCLTISALGIALSFVILPRLWGYNIITSGFAAWCEIVAALFMALCIERMICSSLGKAFLPPKGESHIFTFGNAKNMLAGIRRGKISMYSMLAVEIFLLLPLSTIAAYYIWAGHVTKYWLVIEFVAWFMLFYNFEHMNLFARIRLYKQMQKENGNHA